MAYELRPYQSEAVEAVWQEWASAEGNGRTLCVQATGTGKTIVMAALAERVVREGGRVLLLAHRDELIRQARDKFMAASGLECAIEKASSHAAGALFPVTIASVQTLGRERRLREWAPDAFTHIFIDEAHHSLADTYLSVINYFEGARVLGVTATPDRADKRGLAEVYDSIAYEYGIDAAVRDGYLCPITAQLVPIDIDLSQVRQQAGDFQASGLDSAIEPYLKRIAQEMAKIGCDRRHTVVFLPLVRTAERMAEELRAVGIAAEEIDGQSEDRHEILARFESGETSCLTCSMLLTEGWDCPSCDCVVVLRPTRSRGLFAQMIGRGTRLHPGKESLLVIDFLWNTARHDLCRPASLVAETGAQARAIERAMGEGGAVDLLKEKEDEDRRALEQREASLAAELERQRHKRSRFVDPLLFFYSIEAEDLALYEPTMPQETLAPTQRQLQALQKFGIEAATVGTRGLASLLLDRLIARSKAHMATARQIRQLERLGFRHPGTWTFDEASGVMDMLAKSGWKVPSGIDPKTYDPSERRKQAAQAEQAPTAQAQAVPAAPTAQAPAAQAQAAPATPVAREFHVPVVALRPISPPTGAAGAQSRSSEAGAAV